MKNCISIIIPFHTVNSLLYRAIESVVDQEYKDWECVLVGDNIINNDIEKVLQYIKSDLRFKLIEGADGANNCRNIGIANSDSKYLIFLDADDILMPNCIKDRISFFDKNVDNDFIISQTATFKNDPSQITGYFRCQSKENASLLIKFLSHNIQWNTTAPTWKRTFLEQIGNWNIEYPRLQDVELNIRALLSNPKIELMNIVDSYYYFSNFSEDKQHHSLYGFTLLIKDYYHKIYEYFLNINQIDKIVNVFKRSVNNILSSYKSRPLWMDPNFNSLFYQTVISINELNIDKENLKKELNITTHEIWQKNPNPNGIISFLDEISKHLATETTDVGLKYGDTGALLFLFYYQNFKKNDHLANEITELVVHCFKTVKKKDIDKHFTYWNDSPGTVAMFEIINKYDIADIDIETVFKEVDYRLSTDANMCHEADISSLGKSNLLWNRLARYPEKENSDAILVLIRSVDQIIKELESFDKEILSHPYLFQKIILLEKISSIGIYKEYIDRFMNYLSMQIENDFNRLKLIKISNTEVNGLFAYNKLCLILNKQPNLNWSSLIQFKSEIRYKRLDIQHIIFMQNIIKSLHEKENDTLRLYIKKQLEYDMSFVSGSGLLHPNYINGLIGYAGVGLLALSFLNQESSNWDEILLLR